MKHKLFSRFISVLLAVVMLASLMSMPSLATDDVQEPDPAVTSGEQMTDSTESDVADPTDDPAAQSDEITDEGTSSGENTDEPVVSGEENDETVVSGEENSEKAVSGEEEATVPSEEETVSNDEAASSDEEEDASSQEETAPAAVQLTAEAKDENDNVVANVTAEADEGVIPEGSSLVADLLTGNDAETAAAELDEAGVEYDGYMALDIHLEDANGNEVEPNGEVRVVMVAPAALPEDADPTTVAVQHHEEQDNGEVKVEEVASAVDTAALAATPATLDLAEDSSAETPAPTLTTDDSQVTAAFDVESFSTFTITWGTEDDDPQVTVYYVDTEGNQIKTNVENRTLDDGTEFDLATFGTQFTGDNGAYKFLYACLDNGPAETGADGLQIIAIKYSETEGWQYKQSEYSGWQSWKLDGELKDRRVFLVYYMLIEDPGTIVDTVDTAKDNEITINLFDYVVGKSNDNDLNSEINKGRTLKFKKTASGSIIPHPNFWTGYTNILLQGVEGGALQGIVQNELVDGYPVLKQNSSWDKRSASWKPQNESLSYLFDDDETVSGKVQTVMGATNLFQKDADGYYYFDSSKNMAVLPKNSDGTYGKEFTVYSKASKYFNPFQSAENNNSLNYHFGMTIETSFIMPEGGQVNGQDMIFEFTGDDDVWVFIDNKLVLDIGGIHGAVTGTINFQSGAVDIDMVNNGTLGSWSQKHTDLDTIFDDEWDDTTYKPHTLKFFYLERGAGDSNCKIRFNLPVVPKASLLVSKTLADTNSDPLQDYLEDTMTYRFRVVKEDQTTPYFEENTKYNIMEGDKKVGEGTVDKNGVFTLKAGQIAVFPEAFGKDAPSYFVQELLPLNASGQYGDILYTYTGSDSKTSIVDDANNIQVGDTIYSGYQSELIIPVPGQTAYVSYTNKVDTTKMALLKITKDVPGGAVNDADTFKMEVTVNDKLLPVGTTYTLGEGSGPQSVKTAGIIELKAGQTASIAMLAGENTSYKVVEQLGYDQSVYEFGSYTGTSEYTDSEDKKHNQTLGQMDSKRETGITNTVTYAGQVDSITVTNNTTKGYLTIEKKLAEGSKLMGEGKDVFAFKIQKCDESGNPTGTVWYMYAKGEELATLDGSKTELELESGTYQITELSNINYTCTNIEVTNGKIEGDKPTSGSYTIKVSVGGNATTNVIYTNERSDKGFTDGSGVINKFSSDESGVITFDRFPIAGDTDEMKNWSDDEPTGEQQN